MLRRPDITNLSTETASEIEVTLIDLDRVIDLTGWHVDVFSNPLEPRIAVTVTAPDGRKSAEVFPFRIETPVSIRDFVAQEHECWRHRVALKNSN